MTAASPDAASNDAEALATTPEQDLRKMVETIVHSKTEGWES